MCVLDIHGVFLYTDLMKTFIIKGRQFSQEHGYLATSCTREIEAKNKTQAIKIARDMKNNGTDFTSCNRFEVIDEEYLKYQQAIREHERDYWKQEEKISDDPPIKP